MKYFFTAIIFTISMLKNRIAIRISDFKCWEYSNIVSNPENRQPFIVRIIATVPLNNRSVIAPDLIGILISDQYVLTSYFGNVVYKEVFFTSDDRIKIKENVAYENNDSFKNNIVLLKLASKLILDSDHRPACLWTKTSNNITSVNVVEWTPRFHTRRECYIGEEYVIRPLAFLNQTLCSTIHRNSHQSIICLISSGKGQTKDFHYNGSPIYYESIEDDVAHNSYVLAASQYDWLRNVSENGDEPHIAGVNIFDYLEWIEEIVWLNKEKIQCGRVQIQTPSRVAFGEQTIHGEFPWHVALYRTEDPGVRKYMCGGSLLNQNTVLTAAHCVFTVMGFLPANVLIVSLGKHDLELSTLGSLESRVDNIILHENFKPTYLENDIAIIKLCQMITFSDYIQPICITETPAIFKSDIGVVAGWGRNELNELQTELTKANMPIRPPEFCRDSNRQFFPYYLNEKNFCAGYQNGTNVCTGDSGGGLVFEADGTWYLRGIVSLGVAVQHEQLILCDILELVLFTDVSKFYRWIKEHAESEN